MSLWQSSERHKTVHSQIGIGNGNRSQGNAAPGVAAPGVVCPTMQLSGRANAAHTPPVDF